MEISGGADACRVFSLYLKTKKLQRHMAAVISWLRLADAVAAFATFADCRAVPGARSLDRLLSSRTGPFENRTQGNWHKPERDSLVPIRQKLR